MSWSIRCLDTLERHSWLQQKFLLVLATGGFAREYKQVKGEPSMEFIALVGVLTVLRGFPAMDAARPPDHDSPGTSGSNRERD